MPSAQSALRATGVVELRSGEYRLHLNILEFLILVQLDFYPCILLNEKSPAPNKMYHCGDLIAWLVIAMFNIVGREIFVDFRKWCSGGGKSADTLWLICSRVSQLLSRSARRNRTSPQIENMQIVSPVIVKTNCLNDIGHSVYLLAVRISLPKAKSAAARQQLPYIVLSCAGCRTIVAHSFRADAGSSRSTCWSAGKPCLSTTSRPYARRSRDTTGIMPSRSMQLSYCPSGRALRGPGGLNPPCGLRTASRQAQSKFRIAGCDKATRRANHF